jgi:sodium-dependent phosphate cotransporter
MGDHRPRDQVAPDPTSPSPHIGTWARLVLAVLFLYIFLVGIKALEKGIGSLGAGFVDDVFATVAHPLAGLAAGVLATVLVQSSSVTTSTIVGLVGAGALGIETAVPMVMGANIGTTITGTLAALGHVRQSAFFRRAFAAATVHDYFNILAVIVLFPLEVAFGAVSRIAIELASLFDGLLPGVSDDPGPVKRAIETPVDAITGIFESLGWERAAGSILIGLGVVLIFLSLWQITTQMRWVVSGQIEAAINRILGKGAGAGAMLVGLVLTVAVQSSSITTSMLVPLAAAGVLTLSTVYPVALGANVGTTITALLASVAADNPDALVVAIAHTTFNLLGILIFYPIPMLRRIPVAIAEWTAEVGARRRGLIAVYIIGMFFVVPIVILFIT